MSKTFNISVGIIIAAVTCFFKFYTINDYGVAMHSYDEYICGEKRIYFFPPPEVKIILMFLMMSAVFAEDNIKRNGQNRFSCLKLYRI